MDIIIERCGRQAVRHRKRGMDHVWQNSGRVENRKYWDQIVQKTLLHMGRRLFLPAPIRNLRIISMSVKYIRQGVGALLRGRILLWWMPV